MKIQTWLLQTWLRQPVLSAALLGAAFVLMVVLMAVFAEPAEARRFRSW